ncbi:hypothetical protein SAMN05444266_103320 [Chitinophaga jiangningensis]|uniref:Lipoprotein n=1 Tax=Chitinophaga jiangningensis TaxID=1419482 RepID=A0A1M7AKL9_9BACT|nr:hypothetical protein [Chitinophaga jiangningensis]SHL43195.1 hypothetical protein SAMN05444266_103320 [Chitinophaga jiangningensis]
MKLIFAPIVLLLIMACNNSRRVYSAPAMGAESEFDNGLRPERRPQYLFDKKTMKDMQKTGTVSDYNRRQNTRPTAPVKKAGAVADTSALPADSTRPSPQTDTLPPPADTSHQPLPL